MEEPFRVKSIFEELAALREADDDPAADAGGGDDAGATDAGGDDEISIDTDLKEEDTTDDANNAGGDDNGGDDLGDLGGDDDLGDLGGDEGGDDTGGGDLDTGSTTDEEQEANKANTDMFSSLSKEEQQMKIQKLKKLFGEMYSSCEDLGEKIDNIDYDIVNHETVSRLASALYRTRDYLSDYITKVFDTKSYYENDVEYWKFMSSFSSIAKVAEELLKEKQKILKGEKK